MGNYIECINQYHFNKIREVIIHGRNLIIVGDNGAGKTKFLSALNNYLVQVFNRNNILTLEQLKKNRGIHHNQLMSLPEGSSDYQSEIGNVEYYEALIKEREIFDVIFCQSSDIYNEVKRKNVFLRFFEAHRRYESHAENLLTSVDDLFEEFKANSIHNINFQTSSYFERYLVSMSNYALIEKGAGAFEEFERVVKVVEKIQNDLRELFEDFSLKLVFNRKKLRMQIEQENKEPFGLSTLPSGFASILAIYSELIMLSELSNKGKGDIKGIVLIDEIDAHLHVTVQKKVFDFFSKSFPGVQFIISTHSPFVIQSVSNAVIYNLSNNERMEDLSAYSYTSIIKGLLGESANSTDLEKFLQELDELSKLNDFNIRFNEINDYLDQKYDVLDARAKAIVMGARARKIDWEEAQGNV
ncbi:TPA: AAA family ATPase [Enterobacter hormaechei subsp. steigerwaltii]